MQPEEDVDFLLLLHVIFPDPKTLVPPTFCLSPTPLVLFPPQLSVHLPTPPSLTTSPLSLYSVPLATVSKVPIPKGWRRGPVMSCTHNSTPVIHGRLSVPLCHCHPCLFFTGSWIVSLYCIPLALVFFAPRSIPTIFLKSPKRMFHHYLIIKFTLDSGITRFAPEF